ncbi:ANTAR domain-containing protein [Arthrobacter sp. RIT-PI-e]|uniref:ANTAR domain-containing protein n=1 Tax=Arthrobacter sp. RIT-PI-e TaxID=1681197 RepID=UPI001364C9BF|nr:ANTAR domain-containing protein [Arthrobacter sp. RIT-PI-e]
MPHTHAALSPYTDLVGASDFRHTASDKAFDVALEARSLLDTAVGIVMGKHDLDRASGLANLQRTAQTFNVTVLELARGLVSTSGEVNTEK